MRVRFMLDNPNNDNDEDAAAEVTPANIADIVDWNVDAVTVAAAAAAVVVTSVGGGGGAVVVIAAVAITSGNVSSFSTATPAITVDNGTGAEDDGDDDDIDTHRFDIAAVGDDGVCLFLSVVFPLLSPLWLPSSFSVKDDVRLVFGGFPPLPTCNRSPCPPPLPPPAAAVTVNPVVVFVIVDNDTGSGGGVIDDEVASSVGVFVPLFLFEVFIVLRLLLFLLLVLFLRCS